MPWAEVGGWAFRLVPWTGWTSYLDDGGFGFDTVWISLVFYLPFVAYRRI
jgi:hypothetical protein